MSFLYRWRGALLGFSGLLLLLLPPVCAWWNPFSVALLLLAACLRVWARCFIGLHTRGQRLEAPELIRSGPYARMRHPLYLSNALVGLALLILHAAPGWLALAWLALFLLFLQALAKAEDAWLHHLFSGQWEAWASHVPAWGWARRFSDDLRLPRSVIQAVLEDAWTWFWWLAAVSVILLYKVRVCFEG